MTSILVLCKLSLLFRMKDGLIFLNNLRTFILGQITGLRVHRLPSVDPVQFVIEVLLSS